MNIVKKRHEPAKSTFSPTRSEQLVRSRFNSSRQKVITRDGARTHDHTIKSRALFLLSYTG
eukprot:scaffold344_cov189-Alexandrium_tamarense.AAC.12